ncbi:MAG: serine hydrolase domain-containing protein [Ferruginibacter sp.]
MAFTATRLYSHTIIFFMAMAVWLFFNSGCHASTSSPKNSTADSIPIINLPKPGKISASEAERIKQACQAWYDTVLMQKGFNGGMIVAKDGNIVFEKYTGTGHLPGNDAITDSTPMHIASVSKTFTAMAVLKLRQDGKLNIDDEFSKYFPAFSYPGLTIRCLLSHRSGLPNYNYFMETLGWDKSRYVSNEDVLNYLVTRKGELPDINPPCAHFTYCNTNYALLALLIEKVSGLKYADYLNRNFFRPLQMKHTYVFSLADTLKAIPSYNWRGTMETFNFLDQVYGDKNIYTTPQDLLTWDRALTSGLIFTPETLEQAYAPYSNEKPGQHNYGLGWRMNIFPEGNKIIYHNGWWHGSNAAFIRLLKEKATIILIGNRFNRAVYHAKVLTSLFGDYYLPAEEEETVSKDSVKPATPVLKTDTVKSLPAKNSVKRKKGKN